MGRGGGWVGGGGGVCVRARKHLHAHEDTFSYKQCLNNTQAHREGDKIVQAPKKRHCANLVSTLISRCLFILHSQWARRAN